MNQIEEKSARDAVGSIKVGPDIINVDAVLEHLNSIVSQRLKATAEVERNRL